MNNNVTGGLCVSGTTYSPNSGSCDGVSWGYAASSCTSYQAQCNANNYYGCAQCVGTYGCGYCPSTGRCEYSSGGVPYAGDCPYSSSGSFQTTCTVVDPCAQHTTCSACSGDTANSCGFCASGTGGTCSKGTSSGPSGSSYCAAKNWNYYYTCPATYCGSYSKSAGGSCSSCASSGGACGWCEASNSCLPAGSSGPNGYSCSYGFGQQRHSDTLVHTFAPPAAS